jgi:hypothetical protein
MVLPEWIEKSERNLYPLKNQDYSALLAALMYQRWHQLRSLNLAPMKSCAGNGSIKK